MKTERKGDKNLRKYKSAEGPLCEASGRREESKTGKCERENSKTCNTESERERGREMCYIEWVFVKASNKASRGGTQQQGKGLHCGRGTAAKSGAKTSSLCPWMPLLSLGGYCTELLSDSMERLSTVFTIISSSSSCPTERSCSGTKKPPGANNMQGATGQCHSFAPRPLSVNVCVQLYPHSWGTDSWQPSVLVRTCFLSLRVK